MKHPFALNRGEKVAVLRPDNPQLAIDLSLQVEAKVKAEGLSAEQRNAELQRVMLMQSHTFVGFLGLGGKPHPRILNEHGWGIGSVKPGDSFVPFKQIEMAAEAQKQSMLDAARASGVEGAVNGIDATCPCGLHVGVLFNDANEPVGITHAEPQCDEFKNRDPLDYVTWLNQQIAARDNGSDPRDDT